MDREDDFNVRELIYELFECLIDMAHRFSEIFPAMRRNKDDTFIFVINRTQKLICKDIIFADCLMQSIDYCVARNKNIVSRNIFP